MQQARGRWVVGSRTRQQGLLHDMQAEIDPSLMNPTFRHSHIFSGSLLCRIEKVSFSKLVMMMNGGRGSGTSTPSRHIWITVTALAACSSRKRPRLRRSIPPSFLFQLIVVASICHRPPETARNLLSPIAKIRTCFDHTRSSDKESAEEA